MDLIETLCKDKFGCVARQTRTPDPVMCINGLQLIQLDEGDGQWIVNTLIDKERIHISVISAISIIALSITREVNDEK